MVIPINVNNPANLDEGIIFSQPICEENSLIIPNSIVSINKNNQALITIINKSSENKIIPVLTLEVVPLPKQANIIKLDKHVESNHVKGRVETLNQNLRINHLNKEEKDSLLDNCHEFNDIFYLPTDELTRTSCTTHSIPTVDKSPVFVKSYRFPEIHKTEVNRQVEKMLNQGIIEPSTSPYSAPLWVVPKKSDASGEKKWRLVVDYRKLNEKTIGDTYPLY